jgi:ATP-dependent DNA helicase RecQ
MPIVEPSREEKTLLRLKVFNRDLHRCTECNRLLRWDEGELHHVKPRSLGGDWSMANLVTLCSECHRAKKG